MLSIQLLLILLQGTFVFLITGKHAFWICRESEDGGRRTSAYRNTWRSDRPRAQFGHNLRRATAGLQTLICRIVCTFSWRLQNTVCNYSRFPHKHTFPTSLKVIRVITAGGLSLFGHRYETWSWETQTGCGSRRNSWWFCVFIGFVTRRDFDLLVYLQSLSLLDIETDVIQFWFPLSHLSRFMWCHQIIQDGCFFLE